MRVGDKSALPELLAPAGTPAALAAAIEAGADAVYFGGAAFNARMRAQNFTAETMRESIALCHAYGVKAYITLNTLLTDRELPQFLAAAREAYAAGADALIVADLGAAALLHRALPDMPLHASTQMSGHCAAAAHPLKDLGFTRMVLAREASATDMRRFVAESGLEAEVFVHGALCVSHSGQCLFSSLVGGRSGNRGECAQPCRLPDKKGNYPLSLKDLSLAAHVPQLIEMGVASLKIEGRLKSPEYVRDVVRIWRRLLDERRAATAAEMQELAAIFSRGGFTDGYFTGKIDNKMLGVRSAEDKERSREGEPFLGLSRRVPISFDFTMKAEAPITLTAVAGGKTVTVSGDIPFVARTAPMDEATVAEKLTRLGGTPYVAERVKISLDAGLMVPVSRLNALRRAALDALSEQGRTLPTSEAKIDLVVPRGEKSPARTARFEQAAQITTAAADYFSIRYLPLAAYHSAANGVVLPAVIFDSERDAVLQQLKRAKSEGATHALVGNVGHLSLALAAGLIPHGDFRLNVTNRETLAQLHALGFADVLLSPELTLPQIKDIGGASDVIVYGRVPLMLLEKCAGKAVGDCRACHEGTNQLVDRRGEKFPVLRLQPHRSIVVNSRSTVMSDKQRELRAAGIAGGHYVFTVESPTEVTAVITAYQNGITPTTPVRRI